MHCDAAGRTRVADRRRPKAGQRTFATRLWRALTVTLMLVFLVPAVATAAKKPAPRSGGGGGGRVYPQYRNPYGVVRWISQQMPLKVYITHGLTISDWRNANLPEVVNDLGGPLASMDTLNAWPKLVKAIVQNEHFGALTVSDGYTEDMWKAAAQGIGQWKVFEKEGLFKLELTEDPNEANVFVFWTPHFTNRMGMAITQNDTKGCTSKDIFPYKVIQQVLNGQIAPERVAFTPVVVQLATCARPFGGPLPLGKLVAASAHEMGHVLGIDGHSTNPGDLMCLNYGRGVLSVNDAATIRYLYRCAPDLVP